MRNSSQQSGGRKQKIKRVVPYGRANVKSTFNNTIISIADPVGNVLCWASAGPIGFSGQDSIRIGNISLLFTTHGHHRTARPKPRRLLFALPPASLVRA